MTRTDKMIVAAVFLAAVALGGIFWLSWRSATSQTLMVVIEVDGQMIERFPLSSIEPGQKRRVLGPLGYSTIEAGENMVRMASSPCPDKVCVKMGLIGRPGETIVCVPNRVVIRIAGMDELELDSTD